MAQTTDFQQRELALFLRNDKGSLPNTGSTESGATISPRRRQELPKKSAATTVSQSIDGLIDTLFVLLQHVFEAQEQMWSSSRHLVPMISTSAKPAALQKDASRWRQQIKVFLLANPVVASASRKQVVGLSKSVMPLRAVVDNDSKPEALADETTSLSISLWLYVNELHHQLSPATKSTLEQPSSVDSVRRPCESLCVLAVGGATFQVPDAISSVSDVKSPGMILVATPVNDEFITLSLITSGSSASDAAWNCVKIADSVPTGCWCHLALVVSSAVADALQAFVNGDMVEVPDKALHFAEDYFDEAYNWSTVHIGGQTHDAASTQSASNEVQGEPQAGPSTRLAELSVVLDDVWMVGRGLSGDSIKQLYSGGPMLFQAKRQVLLEDRGIDLLRVLHATVAACPDATPANSTSEMLCSDRWITLLTRLHASCVRTCNSAAVVYLCEILSQLLPMAPASSTIDLLDLARTCFRHLVLESCNEDVSPVRMLLQLTTMVTGLTTTISQSRNAVSWYMRSLTDGVWWGLVLASKSSRNAAR